MLVALCKSQAIKVQGQENASSLTKADSSNQHPGKKRVTWAKTNPEPAFIKSCGTCSFPLIKNNREYWPCKQCGKNTCAHCIRSPESLCFDCEDLSVKAKLQKNEGSIKQKNAKTVIWHVDVYEPRGIRCAKCGIPITEMEAEGCGTCSNIFCFMCFIPEARRCRACVMTLRGIIGLG